MTQDEMIVRKINRSTARKMINAANSLDRMASRLVRDLEEYISCLDSHYPDEEVSTEIILLEWAKEMISEDKAMFYSTIQDAQLIMLRNCEPSSSWKTIIRDGEEEYICEHDIGHWHWPHSCDGCCRHDNYPGRGKKVDDDLC